MKIYFSMLLTITRSGMIFFIISHMAVYDSALKPAFEEFWRLCVKISCRQWDLKSGKAGTPVPFCTAKRFRTSDTKFF